jgi:hypothetical protein
MNQIRILSAQTVQIRRIRAQVLYPLGMFGLLRAADAENPQNNSQFAGITVFYVFSLFSEAIL